MKISKKGLIIKHIRESFVIMSSDANLQRYSKEYNDSYLHWDVPKYREFGNSTREDVWFRQSEILKDIIRTGDCAFVQELVSKY